MIKPEQSHSLPLLGDAAEADRILLFVNHKDLDGTEKSSLNLEWHRDNLFSFMGEAVFQKIQLDKHSLAVLLKDGNEFIGKAGEVPESGLYELLAEYHMNSLLLLPIHVRNSFWGFIIFVNADEDRRWSNSEISAVKAYVNSIERAIERKVMSQELEKSKQEAEKASYLKGRFLANMSHEIRTPMNGMVGFIELLQNTNLTSQQSDYLNSIKAASESLLLIMNDILDYSKLDAERMVLEDIIFELRPLIKDSVELFMPKAVEKNIKLEWHVSPDIPKYLYGDPGRLKQIFYNLISNSVKFTEKGIVSLSVDTVENIEEYVKLKIDIIVSFCRAIF